MTKQTTYERWVEWNDNNPEFYEMFERFAFEAIRAGRKKFSAWLIVNRIRWETALRTEGDDYNINNNFIAFFARLFMRNNPKYRGFFNIKKMSDEDEATFLWLRGLTDEPEV